MLIERFDRKWIEEDKRKTLLRLPQEDMCQALGISSFKKYQNEGGPNLQKISEIILRSKVKEDLYNFFKTILIFDFLFATDGHAKNFSIFLQPNGFKLTPLYDVMSGYFLYAREKKPLQKLKLAMSVGNSNHYPINKISKRHYAESAKKCFLSNSKFEEICEDLKEKIKSLDYNSKELDPDLNKKTLDLIVEGIKIRSKKILD